MDKDVEMDNLKKDDSSKPERQRRGSDSSKEKNERQKVPLDEERKSPVKDDDIKKILAASTMADDIEMEAKSTSSGAENNGYDSSDFSDSSTTQEENKDTEDEVKKNDKNDKKVPQDIDSALEKGKFKQIKKWVTPQTLARYTTNCIEKSLEVSHRLKKLGESKGSNKTELNNLATQVEDFAFHLLDPLKNDDQKRNLFKKNLFDRVSEKALKHRQKKFVSHSVYNDLLRQKWTRDFYEMAYIDVQKKWFTKWFLLNVWTFFDTLLFPLVHVILGVIHLINKFAKKRQGIRAKEDIFDRYVKYFTTPYFIFFRDTLSYLALLGLHFAMCLQPSTIHFTAVEWIILVFFLGRLMMEINQLIPEQNSDWKESQRNRRSREEPKEQEQNEEKSEPAKQNKEKKQDKNNNKTPEPNKLWKIISSHFNDWWNILDLITLIVFLPLFGCRAFIWSQHYSVSKNRLLAITGYMYGLNAMFLTLRVFGQMMEYNKSTGSIQIALFHIIGAVFIIFGQFLVATLAFSLAITKIYVTEVSYSSGKNETSIGSCKSQNALQCWWGFTRHLAWSLLGFTEFTPLQSSDDTSDALANILYALFLIMGVVMLMNMMIALLSNTYQQVENNAFYEWSYKKATTIRTYSKYHPVPVPFNIISLSFILLRHFYICCKTCKLRNNKDKKDGNKGERNKGEKEEEEEKKEKELFEDLEEKYLTKYGSRFPKTDKNKMDRVFKETKGNRMMNRNIAQRVFRYDQKETQQLESHGDLENWKTSCIAVVGQQLELHPCKCKPGLNHGARYVKPLSEANPEFEVLILEMRRSRKIAIGVVTKKYELSCKFPGWEGNTAGFHIDDGKIYDFEDSNSGRSGDDAMAYRGDLIGCKILYDKEEDGKLPVSFTLNGRVVGEAKVDAIHENQPGPFYPYVGIGWKGITLLFRMCFRTDTDPVFQKLENVSEEQTKLLGNKITTDTDPVIQILNTISEQQRVMSEQQLVTMSEQQQIMSDRLTELERKMDHPSRLELQEEAESTRA